MKLQKVRAWTVLQHSRSADISQWASTPFCNRPATGHKLQSRSIKMTA